MAQNQSLYMDVFQARLAEAAQNNSLRNEVARLKRDAHVTAAISRSERAATRMARRDRDALVRQVEHLRVHSSSLKEHIAALQAFQETFERLTAARAAWGDARDTLSDNASRGGDYSLFGPGMDQFEADSGEEAVKAEACKRE